MAFMKPFKPPTLLHKAVERYNSQTTPVVEPPQKKRRISSQPDLYPSTSKAENDGRDEAVPQTIVSKTSFPSAKSFVPPQRKVLHEMVNPTQHSRPQSQNSDDDGPEGFYCVLWRKFTTKKNKTWDGDGVLSVSRGYAVLHDITGKQLGKAPCKIPLLVGSQLSVAGREVEVEDMISKQDFLAGRPFLARKKSTTTADPQPKEPNERAPLEPQAKRKKLVPPQKEGISRPAPMTQASKMPYRAPMSNTSVQQLSRPAAVPEARHDPNAPGALVMKRPTNVPRGKQVVDVVVDPLLSRKLREHQRAGVSFLYECVMGMKDYDGEGAILADEMGLGKTLQTIALLWTLLKQNPLSGEAPVVKKALIVCPVTLINNWRKEFRKWLGNERLGVFVAGNKNTRLTDFTKGKSYSVMIIGYEKLRTVQADLQKGTGIDIVIADEGHRLKTAQNKSALAIKSLNTERRIILSGTPVQNDLTEFYTMVDFINPGLLNKYSTFKREFETVILKGRQPGASTTDVEKAEARSEELADLTGLFILRRTADILARYLPPKTEHVLFCRPTKAQSAIYRTLVESSIFAAALGTPATSLELITILKKVCNSPSLLLKAQNEAGESSKQEVFEVVPPALLKSPGASGKLQVLDSLLHQIRTTTDEKVVLVSNYTSTMDIIANLLTSLSYKHLRLDGSTATNKRQDIVDRFNRGPVTDTFVLLLSAKAGGVGLNLIGASRLILFDLDWNPATDLQAMARVHRMEQKRPCYIYRLITQGALDEKIFQRQISKTGLADSIVDGKSNVGSFSREELRDIFSFDESPDCQTHRLLGCTCGGSGLSIADAEEDQDVQKPRNDLGSLWSELDSSTTTSNDVEILRLDDDDELTNRKRTGWKRASEYDKDIERQEALASETERRQALLRRSMTSLMRYTHFDTSLVDQYPVSEVVCSEESDDESDFGRMKIKEDPLEPIIEDEVLRSLLREDGARIRHVFSKTSA